jgi:hypothetical protein
MTVTWGMEDGTIAGGYGWEETKTDLVLEARKLAAAGGVWAFVWARDGLVVRGVLGGGRGRRHDWVCGSLRG